MPKVQGDRAIGS